MAGDASVVECVGAESCGLQHKKQLYSLSWLEPDRILWGGGSFFCLLCSDTRRRDGLGSLWFTAFANEQMAFLVASVAAEWHLLRLLSRDKSLDGEEAAASKTNSVFDELACYRSPLITASMLFSYDHHKFALWFRLRGKPPPYNLYISNFWNFAPDWDYRYYYQ